MATNAFSSLANIRLHLPARLVSNSCCPDKDLIVLISRLGGTDRMSLWNSNQGTRIWEVDVGGGDGHATSICWSPDGQSIAVMQDPPAVSLHSLQDGHLFLTLKTEVSRETQLNGIHLTDIWWFRHQTNPQTGSNIPDIFKRNDIITGSVHSVLKLLPLLDNLQEDTDKLTATDLFAFQGSHTLKNHKTNVPKVIASWPTLSLDLAAASISTSSRGKSSFDAANANDIDQSNLNSILLVADDSGHLYIYLDGTFPLGCISLGENTTVRCLLKHPRMPTFIGSPRIDCHGTPQTALNPMTITIPLLGQRKTRDLAKMASTSRELVWYVLRAAKEMRDAWYGSESTTGARELGPKWIKALEIKQREEFGENEMNPILDLTCLLTTGRASDSLTDFLGSSEQMSERGLQKWESTVCDALMKLRDTAEKRIAPALQRLHLVLDEILGWSKLPQFALFELSSEQITGCLDLASVGIVITNWLAGAARTELSRFREFISWVRFEVNNVNNTETNVARHDFLEVNSYFMSGLSSSTLDKWFTGPCPHFKSADLGIPDYKHSNLKEALEQAFQIAGNAAQMAWQTSAPRQDINDLDRNVEALIQDLAIRCEGIFHHAAGATSRSAVVSFDPMLKREAISEKTPSPESSTTFPFRDRAVFNEENEYVQHLVSHMPSISNTTMLLAKLRFRVDSPKEPLEISVALLECYLLEEEDESRSQVELLDADFFDDECVVIVYRVQEQRQRKQAFIATVNYKDIGYQNLAEDGFAKAPARQDLMQDALGLWKNGQICSVRTAIGRRRLLGGCKSGGVSIALNGRVGRRVAGVLDNAGNVLETIDMEGEAEDMEVTDDTRTG